MYDLKDDRLEAKYPSGWIYGAAVASSMVLLAGVFTGSLLPYLEAVLIAMLGLFVVTAIAMRISRSVDASWLPGLVAAGFLAKIGYSIVRYLVLVEFYSGSGDAGRYQEAGENLVGYWRSFQVPPGIEIGTSFTESMAALVYVPYVPRMLGGFFMFATLAFLGQMLMYSAFRLSSKPRRLKWYALVIFFLPAISYWPASLGKESLMYFGLGLAVYGASMFLHQGGLKALFYLGSGLGFAAGVRPHMSALIIACLAATLVLAKSKTGLGLGQFTRWAAVLVVGVSTIFLISFAASEFNIDIQGGNIGAEVDSFVADLEDNTGKGGSEVEGGAVTAPQDIPEAALRVLFRPLPHEAHNITALASSLESTVLLLIVLWRSPKILRNLRGVRSDPYVMMSAIMTFGFVILFSPFLNLGLLARERSQILPFLAVVVIQLGWDAARKETEEEGPETRTLAPASHL